MYIFTFQDIEKVFPNISNKSPLDILLYLQLSVYPASTVILESDKFYVHNSIQERTTLNERLFQKDAHKGISRFSETCEEPVYYILYDGKVFEILASRYNSNLI